MGVAIRAVLFEKCPKCIHVQSTKSWSDGYGTGVELGLNTLSSAPSQQLNKLLLEGKVCFK